MSGNYKYLKKNLHDNTHTSYSTMIIMPTENEKASFSISHGETVTKVHSLFPYSWQGER